MKHFWNETGFAVSLIPKMSIDPASGSVLLGFTRYAVNGDPNTRYVLVAESDGPVRSAFLQVNPRFKGCEFTHDSLADGRYVLRGLGDTWDGPLVNVPVVEGVIAGRVADSLPTAVMKYQADPGVHADWSVSADWIVQERTEYVAWSWDLKTQHKLWPDAADPDHLPGGNVIGLGKDLMISVGDGLPAGVMTWNETQGMRPLIRWFGDTSRGAANFGTDGKDMVWTYLQGANQGDGTYDTMSVMTAPYSTDAAQVAATTRRLRSDVKGPESDNWAVGCGYAARCPGLKDPTGNAIFIVRLADGVSWMLPGNSGTPWISWDLALGFTCDELFATVEVPGTVRILRIRLDSLGPGTPPD